MGFFVFFFLQLLQLFRMMLQRFFAVKLHECLVDYETSLTFHQDEAEEIMTEGFFVCFGELILF